jgi:hypothetical protein
MIAILLALQAAPLTATKSSMEPVSVDSGIALFSKLCFEKFPDTKAALEAIADPPLGLTKEIKTPTQAMQPGDSWTSASARVTYVDADWLPRDFGSPQCTVTILLAGEPSHGEAAQAMATKLALPPVKFGKDGPSAQTRWDKPSVAPAIWRIFLTTQKTPSGTEMRMVNMNLRGKKKK